ncbi:hydrogenase expression protein HupH [Candidatus Bathyarchaeota archaeon]|nr:MAG: hydrogenase expression protein HupH [Candidatus Bathyarchaeota archaeon]RLI33859.1 MAG: hydrogenase expression protein HupH [Candidatus Bathyarchaeota archaeon]
MRIRIVSAIVYRRPEGVSREELERRRREYFEKRKKLFKVCPGTEIDSIGIERGPSSIESRYDEILAIPEIVKRVKEAEEEGVDACVINCFGDPGVRASREVVKIPVVGPCEASLLVAASLCNKFSVITVLKSVIGMIEENAKIYGISEKLASVRAVDIPVLELHSDPERTAKALAVEGRKALEEDGAELLVLGCTGMTGMAERLSKELGVYVIDPLPTAVKFAETLVALGLSHSKLAFPKPPEKERYL